jgi:hypothetical protein
MQLVYITHHGGFHLIPPLWSWAIVAGGLYGGIRFLLDAYRQVRHVVRVWRRASRVAREHQKAPVGGP